MNIPGKLKWTVLAISDRRSEKIFKVTVPNERKIMERMRRYLLERRVVNYRTPGTDSSGSLVVAVRIGKEQLRTVAPVIEALMEQTRLARRLILFIPDSVDEGLIPASLRLLERRGLELLSYPADGEAVIPPGAIEVSADSLPQPEYLDMLARQ